MAFSRALRTSFGNTNRVCPSEHDLLTDQRSTLPPIWLTASSPLLWVFFRPKQCGGKHQLSPWHLHASHWRQIAISPAAMHQILGALASPFWTPFHQCGGHLSGLVTWPDPREGYGPHLPHHRALYIFFGMLAVILMCILFPGYNVPLDYQTFSLSPNATRRRPSARRAEGAIGNIQSIGVILMICKLRWRHRCHWCYDGRVAHQVRYDVTMLSLYRAEQAQRLSRDGLTLEGLWPGIYTPVRAELLAQLPASGSSTLSF